MPDTYNFLHTHYEMVAHVVGLSVAKMEQSSHSFPFTIFEKPKQTEKPHHNKAHSHTALEKHLLKKTNKKPPTTTRFTLNVMLREKKINHIQTVQIHLPSLKFQYNYRLSLE